MRIIKWECEAKLSVIAFELTISHAAWLVAKIKPVAPSSSAGCRYLFAIFVAFFVSDFREALLLVSPIYMRPLPMQQMSISISHFFDSFRLMANSGEYK